MDAFTIELVSNAFFQLLPEIKKVIRSFTKFLPEQKHPKGEWEVAISEISNASLYQNVTEGKITFIVGREDPEEK